MDNSERLTCPHCGRHYDPPTVQCTFDGAALYGPKAARRVGTVIGSYELEKILGVGGMGVVYRAKHVMLEKPVAMKVLNEKFASREGGVEQFLREARAATRIRHPNIVDVTDFGTAPDGSVYFVMEYLEGLSLEDILARDGRIALFNAVNIVRQICHALAAAHEEGIVHRDLKPENIFLINRPGRRKVVRRVSKGDTEEFVVEREDNYDYVKLLDFGVAKYLADDVGPSATTKAGMIFGTPQYMSPEQARGEVVDGRSDVYAVGVLFYEMVTGCVPFDGDAALDILNGHVFGTVPPPSARVAEVEVDPGTDQTILRCLEKKPEARYQSMDELLAALTNCFTDRVFLRDAHVMPGALESGIMPPPSPPELGQGMKPRPVASTPPPRSKKSITDELSDLFQGKDGAADSELERMIGQAAGDEGRPGKRRAAAPVVHLTREHAKADEPADDERGRERRETHRGVGSGDAPHKDFERETKTHPGLGAIPKDSARPPAGEPGLAPGDTSPGVGSGPGEAADPNDGPRLAEREQHDREPREGRKKKPITSPIGGRGKRSR